MIIRFKIEGGEVTIVNSELTDLWVPKEIRGRGIGRKLMQKAVKWAVKRGIRLRLRVHPFDSPPIRRKKLEEFYKQYGFVKCNADWMIRR